MNLIQTLTKYLKSQTMHSIDPKMKSEHRFKIDDSHMIKYYASTQYDMLSAAAFLNKKKQIHLRFEYKSNGNLFLEISKAINYRNVKLVTYDGPLCADEESYFMNSTVHNLTELPLECFQLIKQIFDKYHRQVRYGK